MKNIDAISLRQLCAMVEVARWKSIQKASHELNLTQSAVSRRLSDLEAALGISLFERTARTIDLSPQGRIFLRYAEAALSKVEAGKEALKANYDKKKHLISIGALPTVAATLVPKAVLNVMAASSNYLFRIQTGDSESLLRHLHRGQLHLVVGRMPPPDRMKGLQFEPLYSDQLAFVVRADHPLAHIPVTINHIMEYPLIVPAKSAVIYSTVNSFLLSRGGHWPENRIEATSAEFSRSILMQSEAVWVISKGVAESSVKAGSLAFLNTDTDDTVGAIGITQAIDSQELIYSEIIMKSLRETASDIQRELTV